MWECLLVTHICHLLCLQVLNAQSDTGSKSDGDASHSESDDIQIEVKPKKNLAPKRKVQKSEAPRKRKKPAQETERTRKKKTKQAEETSVDENNVQDDVESSEEKSVKVGISVIYWTIPVSLMIYLHISFMLIMVNLIMYRRKW